MVDLVDSEVSSKGKQSREDKEKSIGAFDGFIYTMSVYLVSVETPSMRYCPRQYAEKEQAGHFNVLFSLSHTAPTLSLTGGGTYI